MEDAGPQAYDPFKNRCLGTQYKFTWLPKQRHLTGKRLWFTYAYRQTALWTGNGDTIFEYRWYDKNEFLIARIKNLV